MPTMTRIDEKSFTIKCDGKTAKYLNCEWTLRNWNDGFMLSCRGAKSPLWSINAQITLTIFEDDGTENFKKTIETKFDYKHETAQILHVFPPNSTDLIKYFKKNKLTYRCLVEITSTTGFLHGKHDFKIADEFNDTALNVCGRKLYINKSLLSNYSPVFNVMFNSDFMEKSTGIFTIGDVDYKQFLMFLDVLYGFEEVSDTHIDYLLVLADRFDLELIRWKCNKFFENQIKPPLQLDLVKNYLMVYFQDSEKSYRHKQTSCHDFTVCDEFNDSVLNVHGKQLYVNKKMLASYSPVLMSMLDSEQSFENFDYEQFETLFQIIYGFKEVDDWNLNYLAQLSENLDLPFVKLKCERFLMFNSYLLAKDKLFYAELYKFAKVMEEIKKSDIESLMNNHDELSGDTMRMLFDVAVRMLSEDSRDD